MKPNIKICYIMCLFLILTTITTVTATQNNNTTTTLEKQDNNNIQETTQHTKNTTNTDKLSQDSEVVNDYESLEIALTNNSKNSESPTYTINLSEGKYNFTGFITVTTNNITIIVNGNGQTLIGNKYHIIINNNVKLIINNTKFTNFQAICVCHNNGNLTIENSTFIENNGGIGILRNQRNMIINNWCDMQLSSFC